MRQAGVAHEDLRGAKAEIEATWTGRLLSYARLHRDLHRVSRVGRDDPPADREPLRLSCDERGDRGRGACLHGMLAPPRIGLGKPDRVESPAVERARVLEDLGDRLHGQLHDADPKPWPHQPVAAATRPSSEARTFSTCWLTIGCKTRCP